MSELVIERLTDKASGKSVAIAELLALNSTSVFSKSLLLEPAFRKSGDQLIVNGDVVVTVADFTLKATDGLGITLPTLSVGTDYAIYATQDGLIVSSNFTAPVNYTSENSRRIGGFHYQDGTINERSIWDLKFKPTAKDPRGMAIAVGDNFWADLYCLNTTPDLLGTSAYNAQIADGSSPPKKPLAWGGNGTEQYTTFSQYVATEVLAAYGKRLPNYHEFSVLAKGSKAGYAVGTDPVKTKFDVNARSLIGCEQVSGHYYQWGSECWDRGNGSSGYDWQAVDTNGEGKVYSAGSQGVGASLFGASWGNAGIAGSRASNWSHEPWHSVNNIAARGVCDHVVLL
ncbi:hypothetical protein PVK64_01960 [Aliivibrio sp. S4TY2]|uniref:phage major tropism determinant n=1 Tax=unclassified Aliivibrio TaxID=2645654 RepID=UPI0023795362|nr:MULTISPECIES: hypothetical protein [unclassified Aliivibrio]MDD9154957.1 hypothetical protein [Aliivibrio sp. S4TY2]MDD9158680.1 hypothetical protein [Aliivibrio sp. S4TY1]